MGGNGMSRNTVSAFRLALVARKWPLHNHIQNWNATLTAISINFKPETPGLPLFLLAEVQ